MPKAQQKCSSGVTIDCPSGYCYTSSFTYPNGTALVVRSCGDSIICPNAKPLCDFLTLISKHKLCAAACCTTDNCNNYTPSSATGVMVTEFTLSLMVIVGFIFA
jgi:hypothetical protein